MGVHRARGRFALMDTIGSRKRGEGHACKRRAGRSAGTARGTLSLRLFLAFVLLVNTTSSLFLCFRPFSLKTGENTRKQGECGSETATLACTLVTRLRLLPLRLLLSSLNVVFAAGAWCLARPLLFSPLHSCCESPFTGGAAYSVACFVSLLTHKKGLLSAFPFPPRSVNPASPL